MEKVGESSKGSQTRQRIIEMAAPIFNQHGFAGASIQDIMAAVGLEKGGIYRHFASKEELAAEAFSYALDRSWRLRIQDLGHIHGSIAKLHYLTCRFVDAPSAVPGGCPLMNAAIDSDDGNPVLWELVRDGLRSWKTLISRIVEAGIDEGEIRAETSSRQFTNTMIGCLEGALMICRIEGSREALRDAAASLNVMIETIARR